MRTTTARPMHDAPSGTVVDLFKERVRRSPGRPAFHVRAGDGRWNPVSWEDCAGRVERMSAALSALPVGRGDRVAICAGTSLEWELVQMAALQAGASVVGLDPNYPDAILAELLATSRAAVLFVQDPGVVARIPEAVAGQFKLVVTMSRLPAPAKGVQALDDLLAAGRARSPRPDPTPDDEALVVYSSGTTGLPKAVAYRHEQLALAIGVILEAFEDIDAESRLVCWLPLANLFQRMINFAAMARGATSYVVEDPRSVMECVQTASPHVFIGVPRFFEKVRAEVERRIEAGSRVSARIARQAIALGNRRAAALRNGTRPALLVQVAWPIADRVVLSRIRATFGANLRYFISGSAPMPHRLLEWYDAIGLPVLEAYGVSENIVPIAANRPSARRLGTVGKPLARQEVVLADDGEVLVRGAGVARRESGGGTRGPGAAGAGFLATGDLGAFDADGFLRVVGRKADVFKSSTGQWVSPADIEGRLAGLPYVEHAVVLGAGRNAVVALVAIAAPDGRHDSATEHLADDFARVLADLPAHQRPAGVLVAPAGSFSIAGGELTTNLKLRRRHIEQEYAADIKSICASIDRARPPRPIIRAATPERAGAGPS